MKSRLIAIVMGGAAALGFTLTFIHPFGPVRVRNADAPLFDSAAIDPPVLTLFERSCRNCHSENTQWPLYSYVAPFSWMIERDVAQARGHMNLSQWGHYSPQEQQELLAEVGSAVRGHQMPPGRYLLLHPEAKLSDADIDRIYRWTRAERHRLKGK